MTRMLALFALLAAPCAASAQIDIEADKPYNLQVVLRCGAHNWLGKQFRDDLRGSLGGMLADALGPMANVTVIDLKDTPAAQWPSLWRDVDSRGLTALDAAQELTGAKTHFVRVDFIGGQYEVQARQFDGQTGLVSPLRRDRTADRAFVARLAGKLIAEDFGLIGTLLGKGTIAGEGEVDVVVGFKASGLGARLERWVKPGDVFALMRVSTAGGGGKGWANREPDALVRILESPKNGTAAARVIHRSVNNPLVKAGAAQVFRCIRLDAGSGPMRLRLVDDKGQPHTRTLQVRVHSQAFQKGLAQDEEVLNPDRNGLFVSRRSYDQVAFARVVTGGAQIARIPVPIQEDREINAAVGLDAAQEQFGQLQALRSELLRNYNEAVLRQNDSYKEVRTLVSKGKNEDALKRSRAVRSGLQNDIEQLHVKKEETKKQLAGSNISVSDCDDAEVDLQEFNTRINRLIGQLEDIARLENAPDKVERRIKIQKMYADYQGKYDSADFDGALAVLRQILQDYPDETSIKKRLEELEKQWEIKNNDHRDARDFVFRDWSAAKSVADVEGRLPVARQKLQVLVQVGDQLTLVKLHETLREKSTLLQAEIQNQIQTSPDDTDKKAKLTKLVQDFDKFSQDVRAAITGKNS